MIELLAWFIVMSFVCIGVAVIVWLFKFLLLFGFFRLAIETLKDLFKAIFK